MQDGGGRSGNLAELATMIEEIKYRDMVQLAAELWLCRPDLSRAPTMADLPVMFHRWQESRRPAPIPPIPEDEPMEEPTHEQDTDNLNQRLPGSDLDAGDGGFTGLQWADNPPLHPDQGLADPGDFAPLPEFLRHGPAVKPRAR